MVELTCEDLINYSIISKSKDNIFKYEDVLLRESKMSFKISNLEEKLKKISVLVFKKSATPKDKSKARLLEDSGKLNISFFL